MPVTLSSRTLFLRNHTVTNARNTPKKLTEVEIMPGEQASEPFPVLHAEIIDYDTVQIGLTLVADFEGIEGISFHWAFTNPSPSKYAKAVKTLTSLLIGYFLVVFLSRADGAHTFHEALGILLGVAGIIASNPFGFLQSVTASYSDFFMLACYFAVYRIALLVQIELVRSQQTSPHILFLILAVAFFGFYAVTDANALFEQGRLAIEAEIDMPVSNRICTNILAMHALYFGISIIWMFLACYKTKSCGGKRLAGFGVLMLCDFFATGFSQVYAVKTKAFASTVFPAMLQTTVNMAAGAIVLFFMHSPEIVAEEQKVSEEDEM
jgi:hypothetical protein